MKDIFFKYPVEDVWALNNLKKISWQSAQIALENIEKLNSHVFSLGIGLKYNGDKVKYWFRKNALSGKYPIKNNYACSRFKKFFLLFKTGR